MWLFPLRNDKPRLCANGSERRKTFSYGRSFLSISGMVQKKILPLGKEKNYILLRKKIRTECASYGLCYVKKNRNFSASLEYKHDEMLIIHCWNLLDFRERK